MARLIMVQSHPADSRIKLEEGDTCQTLSARMGTGGGNVPLVLEVWEDEETALLFDWSQGICRDEFK